MIENINELSPNHKAYAHIVCAYELLEDKEIFDSLCDDIYSFYDEYIEEIENEQFATNILELCHGRV